jgi:L-fuconolactonase
MRTRPGTLGCRVTMGKGPLLTDLAQGKFEPLFSAAEKHQVPIMLHITYDLASAEPIAKAHPDLSLLIDHLGIPMPPFMAADDDPWQRLPTLLSLACYPNVAVKVSRAPSLSQAGFPFADLWIWLHRIVDAFGPDRLMWGSDCTTLRGFHTYAEALHYLLYTQELSEADKEKILGGSLGKWLRWPT